MAVQKIRRMLKELILHVGLHKTATTHFQDYLANERGALREQGLEYVPRDTLRQARIQAAFLRARRFGFKSACAENLFRQLANGADRLLISEENMLGQAVDLLVAPAYPDMERRLSNLKALVPRKIHLTLLMSLRDISTILPSAYCQSLRGGKRLGEFVHYERAALAHPPRWTDLALRVRAIFPDAAFRFWRQEDYATHARDILEAVTACRIAGMEPAPDAETNRLSQSAVEHIRKLDLSLTLLERQKQARRIIREYQAGARFDPIGVENRRVFSGIYAQEITRLQSAFPGALLNFG